MLGIEDLEGTLPECQPVSVDYVLIKLVEGMQIWVVVCRVLHCFDQTLDRPWAGVGRVNWDAWLWEWFGRDRIWVDTIAWLNGMDRKLTYLHEFSCVLLICTTNHTCVVGRVWLESLGKGNVWTNWVGFWALYTHPRESVPRLVS